MAVFQRPGAAWWPGGRGGRAGPQAPARASWPGCSGTQRADNSDDMGLPRRAACQCRAAGRALVAARDLADRHGSHVHCFSLDEGGKRRVLRLQPAGAGTPGG